MSIAKYIFKTLFYICASLLVVAFTIYAMNMLKVPPDYEASSRVLVTASHIGEVSGYTCVYSDADSDVAVHLKDGYKAVHPPISAEVTYLETKGYIYSVSDSEFIMEPINIETIIPGVSGTPVYYKGVPIGFISGWDGHGRVRCIFY